MKRMVMAVALLMVPGIACAQGEPSVPVERAFTGFYTGPEAGLHDHRLTLEFTHGAIGGTTTRSYDKVGFGAGLFAGYDLAATRRVRLGVEARANAGGGEGPRVAFSNDATYEAHPRYGFGANAKAGYVIGVPCSPTRHSVMPTIDTASGSAFSSTAHPTGSTASRPGWGSRFASIAAWGYGSTHGGSSTGSTS